MSWILSNWVERRASKERNLRNAVEVWEKAQRSIADACNSLREHYANVGTLRSLKQDTCALTITITKDGDSLKTPENSKITVVSVTFQPNERTVSVATDSREIQEFVIEADCDHAFLTLDGSEILFDEFSRFVLEEAFFTPTMSNSYPRLTIVR
jgi:hypothetical protein